MNSPIISENIQWLSQLPNVKEFFGKFSLLDEGSTKYIHDVFRHLRTILAGTFDEFDFYFFACNSTNPAFHPIVIEETSRKRVLIYMSNDRNLTVDENLRQKFFAIFKNHLKEDFPAERIFALPHGYCGQENQAVRVPMTERKYFASFQGALNEHRVKDLHEISLARKIPFRIAKQLIFRLPPQIVFRELYASGDCEIQFFQGWNSGVPKSEYYQILSESKFCLCLMGYNSPESFRIYEALSCGAVPVTPLLPDTHIFKGAPILRYSSLREALPHLRELASHPTELEKLSLACENWWKEVCSPSAVAGFISRVLLA